MFEKSQNNYEAPRQEDLKKEGGEENIKWPSIFLKPPALIRSIQKKAAMASLALLVGFPVNDLFADKKDEIETENIPGKEKIISDVIGQDLLDRFEKLGFQFDLSIESDESGKYLIHVGQTHEYPVDGISKLMTEEVVQDFQKKLATVLEDVSKLSEGKIFLEGLTEDPSGQRENVFKLNSAIQKYSKKPITNLSDAEINASLISMYTANKTDSFVSNYISIDDVETLKTNFDDFLKEFNPKDELEEMELSVLNSISITTSLEDMAGNLTGSDGDFNSAPINLYMREKIDLLPVENSEANRGGIDIAKEISALDSKYIQELGKRISADDKLQEDLEIAKGYRIMAETKELSDKDAKKHKEASRRIDERCDLIVKDLEQTDLYKKIQELEKRFKEEAILDRDEIAINMIKKYEDDNGSLQHNVMVFGSAHDFTEKLKAYNASNDEGDTDIGLISIKITK